jgi:hypothetical protein
MGSDRANIKGVANPGTDNIPKVAIYIVINILMVGKLLILEIESAKWG